MNKVLSNVKLSEKKSYGNLHPDKTFYVVRQAAQGRGFFSLFSSILCHLHIADKMGFIPVVDFENYPTHYNEAKPIKGTKNAWEYYFEQTSPYILNEVYQSKNVLLSSLSHPIDYSYSITNEQELGDVFFNNSYRTRYTNSYKIYPRKNHKYLLGKEVLIDTFMLAKCKGFIGCTSNIAEVAKFINGKKYNQAMKIDNGPNSTNKVLSKVQWYVKNVLPPFLGGFSIDAIKIIDNKL